MNTVVVPTGGAGTRHDNTVKALLSVNGRSLIDLKLEQLAKNGADHAALLVSYGADNIREHLTLHPPPLDYSLVYDTTIRGPWNAIRWAKPYLPDEFYVSMGDVLLDLPLEHDGDWPWMVVTTNSPTEPYNTVIRDGWCVQQLWDDYPFTHLDCGLYYTSQAWIRSYRNSRACPAFMPRYTTQRTYQANTRASWEELCAALR